MHGHMYHHFHDGERHRPSQGSIDAATFESVLREVRKTHEILSPADFAEALSGNSTDPRLTCLTFDDALRAQHDIAAPIMADMGVTGFFFVYTSVLGDDPDPLEFYRDFRHEYFDSIDDFYASFFEFARTQEPAAYADYLSDFPPDYLTQFSFYTELDRRFRYFRDVSAGPVRYTALMDAMMAARGYDRMVRQRDLFMDSDHLRALAEAGHEIGLHSHSHPTAIDTLPIDEQRHEYLRNKQLLEDVVGRPVWSMSHPCGRYGAETLAVLEKMGVTLGFRSSLAIPEIRSPLEVPRENHVNLIKSLTGVRSGVQ
ncbi:polysaccharide deacetylase family protein [uncultured Sphingomonas sp.]|jgi:peptidoglycan/xylan/chitin deacetylase (PgdA/CDA1 family)|uniref:polysaccharide deacetylase family protein n=1 Tax=uncultured Sphingomonas sp. TaxID=158754 RepID=UPI0030D8E3BB